MPRTARSIYDRSQQFNRMMREYANNRRARYFGVAGRAYNNVVQRALSQSATGRMMIDVSRATDDGFSAGNTVQRLYRMSELNNEDARNLLYGRTQSSSSASAKAAGGAG